MIEDKKMKIYKLHEADYIIWSCNKHLAKALYGRKFKDLNKACLQFEANLFFKELDKRLKVIEAKKTE